MAESGPQATTLIAPSGPIRPEAFQQGLRCAQALGVPTRHDPNVLATLGTFAGSHPQRAAALTRAIQTCEGPLWMVRGGFGAIHTLEHAPRLFQHPDPKTLWAFSDGTALLAAWDRAGWPAWHVPPLSQLARLDEASLARLAATHRGSRPAPLRGLDCLSAGHASGPLGGGNLCVLASLIGSAWQADLRGRIVLLEDVGESAYRVDRLFTQLRLAGAFEGVRGFLFGEFSGVPPSDVLSIRKFLKEASRALGVPALWGAPVGHGIQNAALPFGRASGLEAVMDAPTGEVSFRHV